MGELLSGLLEGLFWGYFTDVGRSVLAFFGLKSNVFAETLLGILVSILLMVLALALFAALV